MSQPYVGEIRIVGFNFAPQGWAFCDGSLLSIAENDVLFNLIGTTYGGDGQSTFALPNLNGRVPVHQGSNGVSNYVVGGIFGQETVTLTTEQMPIHNHPLVVAQTENTKVVTGQYPASSSTGAGLYASPNSDHLVQMQPTSSSGGGSPHENRQPYLVMNYIISLFGVYPSQG